MSGRISRLSRMLQSGEISSAELTESYIARIRSLNPVLNAYVHTTFEEARRAAKSADALIAEGRASALTGIPMTLKDNICTDGLETTCCSKILEGFRPYYDATVWQKLKAQGAVLLGKTNMDEFAMGSTSETSVYGAPSNPVNLSRVTGGSSGGVAAAVKADIAAYGLGSDTGGSIRQPAAFCGMVGFKPTYGTVSRYGLIAYGSSLDQIGPMTDSVEDAAIVYDAIRGEDAHDMTSCPTPAGSTDIGGGVKGLKIGVAEEFFDGIGEETGAAVQSAIDEFIRGGAQAVPVKLPALKAALPVYYIIACAEASSNLGRYDGIRYGYRAPARDIEEMIVKTRSHGFGKEVQKRIMLGTYVLSSGYCDAYYKKACILRSQIIAQFGEVFSQCDLLVAPAAPTTAFVKGYSGGNPIEMYLSDVCTVPVNIAGLPAVSMPCGLDSEGLPIGMQIIANRFADGAALTAARYFEERAQISVPVCGEVKL